MDRGLAPRSLLQDMGVLFMQDRMLEIFLAVAMSRTFGKAAESLNLTPSSVSRELKNLEDELGTILVDRQKGIKSIGLTPAGESFLPLAMKWQEVMSEMKSAFSAKHSHFLKIVGNETANFSLLPDLYVRLTRSDPPICMKIITDSTDNFYERVESREVDVAFAAHQEPSKYVRIAPICRDRLVIARLEDPESEEPAERTIRPDELDPASEFYIEWSKQFALWHNKIWDTNIIRPISLMSPQLIPKLMTVPGQWASVPSCTKRNIGCSSANGQRISWYELEGDQQEITFYKLTHKYPRTSAEAGLAILDKVLADYTFSVG